MPVGLLIATCIMILLDILTGLTAAAMRGELSSKVARQGLMHKSAYLFAIALGGTLDYAQLYLDLGLPFKLQVAVCGYVIMCETLSVVENLAKINPDLRGTPLLELFKGTSEENTKEKGEQDGTQASH